MTTIVLEREFCVQTVGRSRSVGVLLFHWILLNEFYFFWHLLTCDKNLKDKSVTRSIVYFLHYVKINVTKIRNDKTASCILLCRNCRWPGRHENRGWFKLIKPPLAYSPNADIFAYFLFLEVIVELFQGYFIFFHHLIDVKLPAKTHFLENSCGFCSRRRPMSKS